mmetsp:Transcript_53795/g.123388  ORF Transcript_53795/g.123388 Transcript_53795/m.123388 type:complete len:208 (+) Transcript_53795:47-670(+)
MNFLWHFWVSIVILTAASSAWSTNQSGDGVSRRTALLSGISGAAALLQVSPAVGADLSFSTSSTGLQWADAKVGSGEAPKEGSSVAIDYSMSTTGARYGTKIYSTQDKNAPFRFKIGDGAAIKGLEQAIIGGDGVPAMQPGGIRRVIIPSSLAMKVLQSLFLACSIRIVKKVKELVPSLPCQRLLRSISASRTYIAMLTVHTSQIWS